MKLIKSIVRPNKVDDVRDALEKMNVPGMTVTEVRGHGRQKGHTAIYRGKEYNVTLLPKVEIEVVVQDAIAEEVIAARTGEIGDGRVFVIPIEHSYNIRTGERDV
jgi:nitrogen regulatory protein PII